MLLSSIVLLFSPSYFQYLSELIAIVEMIVTIVLASLKKLLSHFFFVFFDFLFFFSSTSDPKRAGDQAGKVLFIVADVGDDGSWRRWCVALHGLQELALVEWVREVVATGAVAS